MSSRAILEAFKLPEIKQKAKDIKLKGYSKLKKGDLIDALLSHASAFPTHHTASASASASASAFIQTQQAVKKGQSATKAVPSEAVRALVPDSSQPRLGGATAAAVSSQASEHIIEPPEAANSIPVGAEPISRRAVRPSLAPAKRFTSNSDISDCPPAPAEVPLPPVTPVSGLLMARKTVIPPGKKRKTAPQYMTPFTALVRKTPAASQPVASSISGPLPDPLFNTAENPPHLTTERCITTNCAFMGSSWIESLFNTIEAQRSSSSSPIIPLSTFPKKLVFKGLHDTLYAQQPHTFQAALRFWIFRLHTSLMGADTEALTSRPDLFGPDLTMWPTVVKCEQLSSEIYLLYTESLMCGYERLKSKPLVRRSKFQTSRRLLSTTAAASSASEDSKLWVATEAFLVLGLTGEVIARSAWDPQDLIPQSDIKIIHGCHVRQDFFEYMRPIVELEAAAKLIATRNNFLLARSFSVAQPMKTSVITMKPIIDMIKTKDSHAYPNGVCREWGRSSRCGFEERLVAERTVISSCLLSGISGTYESLAQQEAGWIASSITSVSSARQRLALFLPESHQVESVTLCGKATHSEVAFVSRQTGRTDVVLRSTGQCIGVEEDGGIQPLWCCIIGCDPSGRETQDYQVEFWHDWETRLISET